MLETLIANYQQAEQIVNDLAILWSTPVCGVPHFGHKAAKKAQPQRIAAGVQLAQAKLALRNYVTADKKLSILRRQQRLGKIVAAIPTFTLD